MVPKQTVPKIIFLFILIALTGGALIYQPSGFFRHAKGKEAFKIYKSQNPALDFTFEYPTSEWTPRESQGSSQKYDAVQVLGPADSKQEYRVYFSIGVRAVEAKPSNADLLSAFLGEMKRFKGFKALEKKNIKIQGQECPSATSEYFLTLPLWQKNAKDVLIRETTVFLTKDKRVYRISYSGTVEQYRKFSWVFRRICRTFQFAS